MNCELNHAVLTATLSATNLDASVVGQAPLKVEIGESARIDVGQAMNYIKSGEAEIQSCVDTAIPQLQNYTALARDWAIKTDGLVNTEAHSAKWYANLSEEYADAARSSSNYAQTQKEAALYYCQQAQTASQLADSKAYVAESAAGSANSDATKAEQYADDARICAWSTYENQKLSKAWATKTDGLVENTDYSSKYYAEQAAASAATITDVVHLSGAETITGSKTFSSQVITATGTGIRFGGTNHYFVMRSTGNPSEGCSLLLDNNTSKSVLNASSDRITIGSSSIPAYANVPSNVTIATGSGQIATCGWVNTSGNNVMHLTNDESVGGNKTFSNAVMVVNSGIPNFAVKKTNMAKGTAPVGDQWQGFFCYDSADNLMARFRQRYSFNKANNIDIMCYKADASSDTDVTTLNIAYPANSDPYLSCGMFVRPSTDNSLNLGGSAYRWKQLFAGTTTISTSDERLKQGIENVPDSVLDAWGEVEFYRYKFNDSVAEKGFDKARYHTGLVAQRIENIFAAHGLNAFDYGLLCFDEWKAQEAEYDESGEIITPALEAGNRYSLRYEECLCLEAAFQRRRADRIEARLAALEARL